MLIRCIVWTICLVTIVTFASPAAEKPVVSLMLSKASAQRRTHDILFRCDVSLDNATGKDLTVHSTFSSVFDGLELVVTTEKGKVLAQQGYTFHQSPFAPSGRDFTLKQGNTSGTLVFPIGDLPPQARGFKVRLVGTLPGSDYRRILSSETIEIRVEE